MDTAQLATLIRAVARLAPEGGPVDEAWIADLARLVAGTTQAPAGSAMAALGGAPPHRQDWDDGPADEPPAAPTPKRLDASPDAGQPDRSATPAPASDAALCTAPATLQEVAGRADLDTSHLAARPRLAAAAPAPADAASGAAPLESLFAPRRVRGILREMAVRATDSGRIDVGALVHTLARGQWPQRLPRQRVTRMGPAVHLLFDAGPDMLPFAADKQQLASVALRILGRDRLRILDFIGTPLAGVRAQRQVRWGALAWPPRGSTLVLVSDFGIGGHESQANEADWTALRDEARRRGVRSVALLPYAAGRWPAAAARFDTALSWDLDAGVQRLRRSRRHAARPSAGRA